MNENPYEKLKRQREESEKEVARIQEELWRMEREKKERVEATAERRHRELIESMKKNGGVNISSGGDTNISGSNLAGGNIEKSDHPAPHRGKVVVKWVFGIVATIIGGLIVAYFKGCFPTFLK